MIVSGEDIGSEWQWQVVDVLVGVEVWSHDEKKIIIILVAAAACGGSFNLEWFFILCLFFLSFCLSVIAFFLLVIIFLTFYLLWIILEGKILFLHDIN